MSEANNLVDMLTSDESFPGTTGSGEEHIVIGKDKIITVPDSLKRIAVQYDHNIETVTFDCPRYWDGVDMSNVDDGIDIRVVYIRADGKILATEVKPETIQVDAQNDQLMHFDWTVTIDTTSANGHISFLVHIRKTDEAGNRLFSWLTEPNTEMYVAQGFDVEATIVDDYPELIKPLLNKMAELQDDLDGFQTISVAEKADGTGYVLTIGHPVDEQQTIEVLHGAKGDPGQAAITFTPSVSPNGQLSWSNDGGSENPAPVNVRGPKGTQGAIFEPVEITDGVVEVDPFAKYRIILSQDSNLELVHDFGTFSPEAIESIGSYTYAFSKANNKILTVGADGSVTEKAITAPYYTHASAVIPPATGPKGTIFMVGGYSDTTEFGIHAIEVDQSGSPTVTYTKPELTLDPQYPYTRNTDETVNCVADANYLYIFGYGTMVGSTWTPLVLYKKHGEKGVAQAIISAEDYAKINNSVSAIIGNTIYFFHLEDKTVTKLDITTSSNGYTKIFTFTTLIDTSPDAVGPYPIQVPFAIRNVKCATQGSYVYLVGGSSVGSGDVIWTFNTNTTEFVEGGSFTAVNESLSYIFMVNQSTLRVCTKKTGAAPKMYTRTFEYTGDLKLIQSGKDPDALLSLTDSYCRAFDIEIHNIEVNILGHEMYITYDLNGERNTITLSNPPFNLTDCKLQISGVENVYKYNTNTGSGSGGGTTVTVNGEAVETFDADTKLDKVVSNGTNKVYIAFADGTQGTVVLTSNAATAASLPTGQAVPTYFAKTTQQGDDTHIPSGVLLAGTPQQPYHAANKIYVDEAVANASIGGGGSGGGGALYSHYIYIECDVVDSMTGEIMSGASFRSTFSFISPQSTPYSLSEGQKMTDAIPFLAQVFGWGVYIEIGGDEMICLLDFQKEYEYEPNKFVDGSVKVTSSKGNSFYVLPRMLSPYTPELIGDIGGGAGGSNIVDDAFSETSENPVQNKVITAAFTEALTEIYGLFNNTVDFDVEYEDTSTETLKVVVHG